MILQDLETYVKRYLQTTWSDCWNTKYNEKEDKIECVWNGIDSTTIEFTYDKDEGVYFSSIEPYPISYLVEMLTYLNNKVHEILEELSQNQER